MELLRRGHGQFAEDTLTDVLVFCFHFRSTSEAMHVILKRAFRCAPREVGQAAIELLDKIGLPSTATLSRARFYADVSFMMACKDKHVAMVSGGAVLFGLLDS